MKEWIWFFGYAKHPTEQNPTGYYEFENPDPALVGKHYGFRKTNDEALK